MKWLTRFLKPANWKDLRTTKPLSNVFGLDRGTPIDRYYIEKFLRENSGSIRGRVLEVENNAYTLKFGKGISESVVLHYTPGRKGVTIVGDLTKTETLPPGTIDCFICTQTFNFIYDFKAAIRGAHYLLNDGGVLLCTLAGLSQISRYDMDRWGDYWRFTDRSAKEVFGEVFGKENVVVRPYGNVLASVGMLHGVSMEELTAAELDVADQDYQIVVTVVATKR